MKTKRNPLLWIGIALLGLLVLTIVLNVVGHLFTQPMHAHMGPDRGGFHHREVGFGDHVNMFGFSIIPFLFNLGLIALGWWIWKKADGESVKKWVGVILLGIGLFSILPLIIAIPILLAAFYFAFKKKKADSHFIDEPMIITTPSFTNSTHDILDEWERKTNKEEY
jgi:hypothetical protein